jgi:hypothetical protein
VNTFKMANKKKIDAKNWILEINHFWVAIFLWAAHLVIDYFEIYLSTNFHVLVIKYSNTNLLNSSICFRISKIRILYIYTNTSIFRMKNEKWKMNNEKWKMKNENWNQKNLLIFLSFCSTTAMDWWAIVGDRRVYNTLLKEELSKYKRNFSYKMDFQQILFTYFFKLLFIIHYIRV